MRLYNERSGVEFDAWFESNPGEPTIPPSVHYRLRNVDADLTLIDTTAVPYEVVSAEGTMTGVKAHIEIPGTVHVLSNTSAKREVFELQVFAGMGTPREYSDTHQYYVVKMGGRS